MMSEFEQAQEADEALNDTPPDTDINYNPHFYPTLSAFHEDGAYFRLVTGPASSGKTYACAWELLMLALNQAPDKHGVRYRRALVVRNTYGLLMSATAKSFQVAYGALLHPPYGRMVINTQNFHARIQTPLPDGTRLDFEIYFRSFDSEASARNALGVEPTDVYIDEISEFSKPLVLNIIRRTGRYPPQKVALPTKPSVIAATNGAMMSHFTYEWVSGQDTTLFDALYEEIKRNDANTRYTSFFSHFEQPSALIAPIYEWESRAMSPADWKPNPDAENIENTDGGYGYYYKQLTDTPVKIRAYVLGKFSALSTGQVVYPAFSRQRHVIPEDSIDRRQIGAVYLSFDFGRTPCCAVICAMPDGRVVMTDEVITEDCAIKDLIETELLPLLKQRYNNPVILGATGDPSGGTGGQAVDLSPINVLIAHGIPIESPPCMNDVDARIEGVRQALTKLTNKGLPLFQVTANCTIAIEGFESSYVFKKKRTGMTDRPDKIHPVSDIQDAIQYIVSLLLEVRRAVTVRKKKLQATKWL